MIKNKINLKIEVRMPIARLLKMPNQGALGEMIIRNNVR